MLRLLLLPLASFLALASLASAQTTGDIYCSSIVCFSATKTASNVTYTLSRSPTSQKSDLGFGWISIGFGTNMGNSPMVIAWPNSDSSITLSQQSAHSHDQPTVLASPPSVATLNTAQSVVNASYSIISFSLADTSAPSVVRIIWAYSTTNPGSSSPSANLVQHKDAGTGSLDLRKSLNGSTSTFQEKQGSSGPYTELQRVLIAHAVFGGLGTMVFIPVGIVIARLLRTFWPRWIVAHWVVHVVLSLPSIIIAFALGIQATNLTSGSGASHFFSSHRVGGLVLFVLMVLQIVFGSAIHWIPASHHSKPIYKGKSLQNLIHPLLGVVILLVGFWTCWEGFDEWAEWSDLGAVSTGVRIVWGILLGIFALAYLGGLGLLPRQFDPRLVKRQHEQDVREEYSLAESEASLATS